jgi:hypothetical protein
MRNEDKGKPLKHKKTRDTITYTSESIPEEFRDTGTDSHNKIFKIKLNKKAEF